MQTKTGQHIQAQRIYGSDPGAKRLLQMCFEEGAIYFWQKGLHTSEMLTLVLYMEVQYLVSAHHGFKNIVTNVPHLSVHEGGL